MLGGNARPLGGTEFVEVADQLLGEVPDVKLDSTGHIPRIWAGNTNSHALTFLCPEMLHLLSRPRARGCEPFGIKIVNKYLLKHMPILQMRHEIGL